MLARFGLYLGGLLLVTGAAAIPVPEPSAIMLGGSPGRNLANACEIGIPAQWSVAAGAEKNVKWKARLGTATYQGAPVVAEGKVFIGTNNERPRDKAVQGRHGVLMCFDEKTGAFLWQIAHKNLDDSAVCGADSGYLASAPAVEGGKVYYVSNRCELVCAETATGKILWSLDMIKQFGVFPGAWDGVLVAGSPLLLDDLVIVGTCNGVDLETRKPRNAKAPSLVAVEKATGKVVWQDASPGADILDRQVSSPAAAEIDGRWQVIHGYGDGWVRGLDAKTGALLWKFDCNPKGLVFNPHKSKDSKGYVAVMPVVHDGKVFVGVGETATNVTVSRGVGHLWCIDAAKKPANKELDLSPVDNDFDPKSPKNKDSGLVWHHGGVITPKPAAEERQFHFGRTAGAVAIYDGVVYAVEQDGYLQVLDAATGRKLWEVDLEGDTWSSPYYVDGKVFIGTEGGDVFVFQAGRTVKLLAKVEMDSPLKTPPVAANGVLYLSDGLHLYALQAAK